MYKSIVSALCIVVLGQILYIACQTAYTIRLHAINEYGRVIHEFDPYFNYRATEYLWAHGWKAFATWFDYMSWYPLGRPVGTTIYPGMQVTSVAIKQWILPDWSINDICCFVPAWFGVLATLATALLAYECSIGSFDKTDTTAEPFGSILADIPLVNVLYKVVIAPLVHKGLDLVAKVTASPTACGLRQTKGNTILASPALEAAVFTACIMAIVPAHLMRSVGGGYDNESIAMFAMTSTFYCWTRSLRGTTPNLLWGIVSGIAYFYMVAAWGGYVFVLNLVGVHAVILVLLGRYSTKLHRAYTAFYLVGTTLATTVPVVGWTPLRSLEQMGPLLAFVGFQLIEVCQVLKRRRNLSTKETWKLRVVVFGSAGVVALALGAILVRQGYFGPISARVRGLFVKHTKTGNPLVDSVAEHQPATAGAYFQYLDVICYLAPLGLGLVALLFFNDASSFLVVYGVAAYFFSHKMVRLVLLTAPIASALAGIVLGHITAWTLEALLGERLSVSTILGETSADEEKAKSGTKEDEKKKDDAKKKKGKKPPKLTSQTEPEPEQVKSGVVSIAFRVVRLAIGAYLVFWAKPFAESFNQKCHELAKALSHPTIIQKAQTRDGRTVTIDDYREAYMWLHDNTPEDARVMAWWDYGYQIAGIANRTTIADGNTWNHEHIALLGRTLTSSEKEGHRIARHLADYILVWAGGGGDDLAKSPHLRRIANSVYRNLCPGDPTCRSFGLTSTGEPSPQMRQSLLYTLHSHKLKPGVEADKNRFKLVFQSKYGKVRIYKILSVSKESKEWVANPANRICDAPGSWFCRGQYPPALQKIFKDKKDFKQLEDFNVDREDDSEYQRQYMEHLNDPDKAHRAARNSKEEDLSQNPNVKKLTDIKELTQEDIDALNSHWENTEVTTELWQIIHDGEDDVFAQFLEQAPQMGHVRSQDGRGPMWWAHEEGRKEMVKALKKAGVREDLKDDQGFTPLDISKIR